MPATDEDTARFKKGVLISAASLISVALIAAMITGRAKVVSARNTLADSNAAVALTQAEYREISQRHDAVSVLKAQKNEVDRYLRVAFRSFRQKEFHDDLIQSIEKANLDTTLVFKSSTMANSVAYWIWTPEAEQSVWFQLTPDFDQGQLLQRRMKSARGGWLLPLEPCKLHLVNFWVEERWDQHDCVLRLALDQEVLAEQVVAATLISSSTRSTGISSETFFSSRCLLPSFNPEWPSLAPGSWLAFANSSFGFRSENSQDEQTEFSVLMTLTSKQPLYVTRFVVEYLQERDFEIGDAVRDGTSRFDGLRPVLSWPNELKE